jgi:hypothetical protein
MESIEYQSLLPITMSNCDGTFKRGMETKTSKADKIANEADKKHGIVCVANGTGDPLVG